MKQISDEYIKKVNGIKCRFAKFINDENQEVEVNISKSHGTHNKSKDRMYSIWKGMRYRCSNPKRPKYKWYGGKGIRVCDEWDGDGGFENFYNWSINNGYSEDLTIDRIKTELNYTPDNCQWITLLDNIKKGVQKPHFPKNKYIGINEVEGLIVTFYNVKHFATKFDIDPRRISECCKGTRAIYKNWKFTREEIDVFETQETIQYWSTMENEFPLEVQSIS